MTLPTNGASRPSFESALSLARAGRFGDAIERLAAELSGDDAVGAAAALAQVARLATAAEDPSAAVRALEAAIDARPGYADLHYQRACALILLKRHAEARAALDRALAINPRYVAAKLERALLDAREGALGEALEALRELSREATVAEAGAFQQGMRHLEQADWDEAQELFARAFKLAHPRVQQGLERFHTLLRDGEVARAMTELRATIAAHPTYPDLHALLGRAELQQGHGDDAMASFAAALQLNPNDVEARVELARALESLGLRTQATDQLALVLERDPTHALARELRERWTAPYARTARRESRRAKVS